MQVASLFDSAVMGLPRERGDDDFECFLADAFEAYILAIESLDPKCHLAARIRAAQPEIVQLCGWIRTAVQQYLSGLPQAAYNELVKGIEFVASRLVTLQSIGLNSDAIGPLYRVADTGGVQGSRERLFHAPFELRHLVSQHRYGIPGFPCLYLGSSLALCLEECRIQATALDRVSVAEFSLRREVRLLDFGYKPHALSEVVAGSARRQPNANPRLEQFIVDYATCWPLMAASSIKVRHDGKPFVYEYIVPQMILQWVMSNDDCDGIRYFSTRFQSEMPAVKTSCNFVFPATGGSGKQTGYSSRLMELFDLTDPILWSSATSVNSMSEAAKIETALKTLNKTALS